MERHNDQQLFGRADHPDRSDVQTSEVGAELNREVDRQDCWSQTEHLPDVVADLQKSTYRQH